MSDNFDPKKYMIKLTGNDYLPVAPRVVWFRKEHPDWSIITKELHADEEKGLYRVECIIADESNRILATGRGRETMKEFGKGPYEKAETIAIGRALSALGYGTIESLDFISDTDGKPADSPKPPQSHQNAQQTRVQPKPTVETLKEVFTNAETVCVKCGVAFDTPSKQVYGHEHDGMCSKCFKEAK